MGKKYKIAIAAAGTAGHINPGLAIANKIMKERDDTEIIFIGTNRGLETDLVPKAGYKLKEVKAYGFSIMPTPRNIKNQIINFFFSKNMAKKVLKEEKVDLVICTGGYITFAVGGAASAMNIPLVMHESNAYPGLAIRSLNKKASKILTGFKKSVDFLKYKDNVVFVGNPINLSMKEVNREEILDKIGLLDTKKTLLVFGGSQGAKRINEALLPIIKEDYFKKKELQLIFATGKNNYEDIKNDLKEDGKHIEKIENVKIFPYIYNMEEIINSADLALTRAGAMTVSEIMEVCIPAIFVPLPSQKANRQIDNARILEELGGATIIENEELTKETLEDMLNQLFKYENRIEKMRENLKENRKENKALDEIYNIIKEYLN